MKNIIDLLRKEKLICKKLEKLDLKTKKKINAYLGVNLNNEYCVVFEILKKSRFINKDYEDLIKFLPSINFRYKRKILVLNSPICSKVMEKLREWKVIIRDKCGK
jgi:hypothetical protein